MHITRSTPIGTTVVFDIAPYPEGYALGAEPTGETARGTLHAIEGDAGISWCFVRVDPRDRDRGEGGEYRHVPMDRVREVSYVTSANPSAHMREGDRLMAMAATCAIPAQAAEIRRMAALAYDRAR